MKFGMIPINIGPKDGEFMVQLAQKAEEVGFESVWTFEHTLIPLDYESKYPYSADGKMGGTDDTPIIDPLISLSMVAGATKTIRLATGVNILPQANPVYLAKQAASLDFVSGGRLMLGLGVGWLKEEYDAVGVPWERRGARFDDYVAGMRKIWSGDVVEHQSDFISWSGFKSHPLPIQKPGVPILIGGESQRALERTAKLGDGWFAAAGSPEQLEPWMKNLGAACDKHGRDLASVEVSSMWFPAADPLDAVKRFEDMGVRRLVVFTAMLGGANPMESLERFANDTMSKL